MSQLTPQEVEHQLQLISRGVEEIITLDELKEKLSKKGRLKVKLGIDPTAKDIHLGFAVVLRKFKLFQELGHHTTLILGDFTAMVGDPSGKNKTRPMLTKEDVQRNVQNYLPQLGKIIDLSKTEVVYNSQWLDSMKLSDFIKLASKYTLAQMLEREDFKKRFEAHQPISLHELIYPLLQAYDSVVLEADVELGGIDQKFNILVARYIQKEYGQEPEVGVLTPILEGLDGVQKMSKSLGNYVGISEPPEVMYRKLMRVPDHLIIRYMILCTDMPMDEINQYKKALEEGTINPRDAKMKMAFNVVRMYWGEEEASKAQEEFIRVFSKGELPVNLKTVEVGLDEVSRSEGGLDLVELLYRAGIASSKREAKRMVSSSLKVNGEEVKERFLEIPPNRELIINYGKGKYLKVKLV